MTSLVGRLEDLLNEHDLLQTPLRASLNPPIRSGDMQAAFPHQGVEIHPDVVALFRWHDGIDHSAWPRPGWPTLIPQFMFRPFQDSVSEQRNAWREVEGWGLDAEPNPAWRSGWFPVLQAGRTYVVVECGQGPRNGSLWVSSIDADEPSELCPSMLSLVDAAVRAFQELWFYYDGGYVETTDDRDPLEVIRELSRD